MIEKILFLKKVRSLFEFRESPELVKLLLTNSTGLASNNDLRLKWKHTFEILFINRLHTYVSTLISVLFKTKLNNLNVLITSQPET